MNTGEVQPEGARPNPRHKYPRTPHLPWSPGVDADDLCLEDTDILRGREVVVTEKLDGENTTFYPDGMHARSMDSTHHPSRSPVKSILGRLAWQIPTGFRLCGENVYARHSIAYKNLEGYFYLFSVWDNHNRCLSWDETRAFAQTLNLPTPRQLYRGPWDEELVRAIPVDSKVCEGYVVRVTESFAREEFNTSIAKWVRKNHVRTDRHWMFAPIVPNTLQPERDE